MYMQVLVNGFYVFNDEIRWKTNYHTDITVPKSNWTILKTGKINIPRTHIMAAQSSELGGAHTTRNETPQENLATNETIWNSVIFFSSFY